MDIKAEGTIEDFIKNFIKDAAKENNKGTVTAYNTYINKERYSVRFKAFILVIQYIKL